MSAPDEERLLLYLHGIRDEDAQAEWLSVLNGTFSRQGLEGVENRGYRVIAPRYLDLLEATTVPKTDSPAVTYKRESSFGYQRAAARYWSACAELERSGIRGAVRPPVVLRHVPTDAAVAAVMEKLLAQADHYCKEADRRSAIQERIVAMLPPREPADVVIVAHSLGTVIAADLVYRLPPGLRVEMVISMGSPLAHESVRRHLTRRRNPFPYERIRGPWVNLTAKRDPVTAFRGLARFLPEAVDVFVNIGADPLTAHSSRAYLDQDEVVHALAWLDNKRARTESRDALLPVLAIPDDLLPVLVGAQYALRLGQVLKGDRQKRFGLAREAVAREVGERLRASGIDHQVLQRLHLDQRGNLKDRLDPLGAINALLTVWMRNPISPYEIEIDRNDRRRALQQLAHDVSVGQQFADVIADMENEARDSHDAKWSWGRAALALAGLTVLAAAPVLVFAAAPAGLAGGAAIVSGLAALGPGGMMGGLGVIGALSGTAGALVAGALTAGSAEQVEETLIYLQAFAAARAALNQFDPDCPEWWTIVAMENVVAAELSKLRQFSDDDARALKELARKLKAIQKALHWMQARGLGPQPSLPPGIRDGATNGLG